jgi:Rod binding domain-containing protein
MLVIKVYSISISAALTVFILFLQCLNFNIPEDDDAHLVFVALPRFTDETEEMRTKAKEVEAYFVEQTLQLSKVRQNASTLPKKYPNPPPDDTALLMKEFLEMVDSKGGSQGKCCKIVISNPDTGRTRIMESFYFTPIVLNHFRKTVRSNEDEMDMPPLEGYSICFNNEDQAKVHVQIVMEAVMVNEISSADEVENKADFDPTAHLTPLTQQLSDSVSAANSVLKEMRRMEKRETKMRITSDSINVRVRYFSYISVAVLLVVTYVQVSYLKRYFQKKKIL